MDIVPSSEMFFDLDFTLRVVCDGVGKLRYRWEVRQPIKWKAVEISEERYPTMEKAYAAGVPVLAAWLRGERKSDRANAKREPALTKPQSNMTNWHHHWNSAG